MTIPTPHREFSYRRRTVLKSLAAVLAPTSTVFAAERVVDTVSVMMFGSTWERVFRPLQSLFREQAGVEIRPIMESSAMEGLARLQASRLAMDVDVWFTSETVSARASRDQNLFSTIESSRLPVLSGCDPTGRTEQFIPYWSFPVGIIYRTDLVPAGSAVNWQTFFSRVFAGEIAMTTPSLYPGCSVLVATVMGGGRLPDVKPGMDYLNSIKSRVAFFNSSDTLARRSLARGDIWAMMGSPSALKELRDAGIPVAMSCPDPTPLFVEGMMLLSGPNHSAAYRFMECALGPVVQAHMTKIYNLLPVNNAVMVPDLLAPIAAKKTGFVHMNAELVSENLEQWTDMFNDVVNG
ncbi:MAG: extracellular solute-binding protein [Acetobacter sp.]